MRGEGEGMPVQWSMEGCEGCSVVGMRRGCGGKVNGFLNP